MENNFFRFVKLGNNYLCVKQNLFKGIRYRCIHKDLFFSTQVSNTKLLKLLFYRLNIFNIENKIDLPLFGQVCIPVYGGYKIFDVFEEKVFKKFSADIETSQVEKEFSQLKRSDKLNCSPAIFCMNSEQRWYQEEYFKSILPLNDIFEQDQGTKNFNMYIVPLLKNIVFNESPVEKNLGEYLNNELVRIKYDRYRNHDAAQTAKIGEYISQIVSFLETKKKFKIYTGLSHGDLNTKNMIVTESGTKLIDWELIGNRSILHDFFNFYFSFLRNNLIKKDLFVEIENAFRLLYQDLDLKKYHPDLSLNDFSKVYRYVYYFERICSLLKFRTNIQTSKKIRNIFRNIRTFQKFEKNFN